MSHPASWSALAKYYDLIYHDKPYEKEARRVHELIRRYKRAKGNELLEVACGTGNHVRHLRKWYRVTGLDSSPRMLAIARRNLPGVRFVRADMESFALRKRFDIIDCLFSSIAFVKTYQRLRKTIRNFATHLRPGGVVIIEPFVMPGRFEHGRTTHRIAERPGTKMVRKDFSRRRGNIAVIDYHYTITKKGKTRTLEDKHELGLFEPGRVVRIMREAGLRPRFFKRGLTPGRGLYLAVKG